jgi:hypothetical protein
MAERVEELIEAMVPALHDMQSKGIFSGKEVKKIIARRRDDEYRLRSSKN